MAALGVFILWLGWFGFNPGSTTAVGNGSFAPIAVNTNLAACAGGLSALIASWVLFKKPDPSLALNGVLAGLVGITAGCANLSAVGSLVVGGACGVAVILSVLFFDKIKVDDPVGAISVHGTCGLVGTLCVGLLHTGTGLFYGGGTAQLVTQAIGAAAAFLWSFPVSLAIFFAIKLTLGLRVKPEEELVGLDLAEHGMEAYPGFSFEAGRDAYASGTIAPELIEEVTRRERETVVSGRS
jgi:Amt family ammonium transporter